MFHKENETIVTPETQGNNGYNQWRWEFEASLSWEQKNLLVVM